jgi:hypothetical protein
MAYPVIDAPYGFKAVNELNGLPYAGATRQFPIARSYNTNLFYGDLVQLTTDGTLIKTSYSAASSPTTPIAGAIGVFVGCQFTNPTTKQLQFSQYYPASTAANDILAFVIDDPSAVFKVAVVGQAYNTISNTVSTIGYANQSLIGTNVYAITGVAGSTTTGNSKMAVSGTYPATSGTGVKRVASSDLPFRVVALVPETAYTVTGTGGTSGSSTTLTLDAAITGLQAGMAVVAPDASAGAYFPGSFNYVTNVNGTTVTLASAITLASGSQVSFVGFPEVLVKWNQGWHSYQFATALA